MSLDVVYQGLPIAKGARVRFEEGALFVETDGPMPVATALVLAHEDKSLSGRVRRVREGAGAGMFIVPTESAKLPRWLIALHPETSHAAEFEPEVTQAAPAAQAEPVAQVAQVAQAVPTDAAPAQTDAAPAQAPEPAQTSNASPAPAAEAAPSNRTPESESSDEEDETKAAGHKAGDKKPAGAAKPKKKPRRR